MTPYNINGKTIYINDIMKIVNMSDAELAEEHKDLIAADIGEFIENPFSTLPPEEPDESENPYDDFAEFEELIRQKMS